MHTAKMRGVRVMPGVGEGTGSLQVSLRVQNLAARMALADLVAAGITAGPLLMDAGLNQTQLGREGGQISYRSHARFLESAAQALDMPQRGMLSVQSVDVRDLGVLVYAAMAAQTLAEVVWLHARYWSLLNSAWTLSINEDVHTVSVEFLPVVPDLYRDRQSVELMVAGALYVYGVILNAPVTPKTVHFVHACHPDLQKSVYAKAFGCSVDFNRSRCLMVLDRAELALPIQSSDNRLFKILRNHCDHILGQDVHFRTDLIDMVKRTVADLLPLGRVTAPLVAKRLGLSERSLHRKLSEDGTSFGALFDALRRDLAVGYLREDKVPLQRIAFLLGYAEQSSFSVAFKRWTGKTPSDVRAEFI